MAGGIAGLSRLVNRIHTCGCREFLRRLPDASIDFCMTSPPYWRLRDYGTPGQIGQEKTPDEYIRSLVAVFREMKRVLKDTGSFYLNMGDTYFGPNNCSGRLWRNYKQLALLPSRMAIALQDDGWILRNDICWHKPNCLPSAVKDRLTNRWEHLFHFVKQRRYYYDLESIREPLKASTLKRLRNRRILLEKTGKPVTAQSKYFNGGCKKTGAYGLVTGRSLKSGFGSKGKNPGDVWNITVKPLSVAHSAAYPEELCVRPILSSCPPRGIVFDPFAGSGTTLVVAKRLGRRFIGCDLNSEYVRIARERLLIGYL